MTLTLNGTRTRLSRSVESNRTVLTPHLTQIDYWITTNSPGHEIAPFSDVMRHYVDATGHPPVLPEFASGFWQCKNRYRNQTEFLDIAEGYLNRSLPLSVLVIDYYHWIYLGTQMLMMCLYADPYLQGTGHSTPPAGRTPRRW